MIHYLATTDDPFAPRDLYLYECDEPGCGATGEIEVDCRYAHSPYAKLPPAGWAALPEGRHRCKACADRPAREHPGRTHR